MGYAGFLPVVPWIQAFIWAFKPTDIVDIRRFPKEEARAVDEDIAHLKGDSVREKVATIKDSGEGGQKLSASAGAAKPTDGRPKD